MPPTLRPPKLGPLCSPTRKEAAAPGKHPATVFSRRPSCALVLVPEMTESRHTDRHDHKEGEPAHHRPLPVQGGPCDPRAPASPPPHRPAALPPRLPESLLSVLPWEGETQNIEKGAKIPKASLPSSPSASVQLFWTQGASSEDFDS